MPYLNLQAGTARISHGVGNEAILFKRLELSVSMPDVFHRNERADWDYHRNVQPMHIQRVDPRYQANMTDVVCDGLAIFHVNPRFHTTISRVGSWNSHGHFQNQCIALCVMQ